MEALPRQLNRKQVLSFTTLGTMLRISPLCLVLAAAITSAHAQTYFPTLGTSTSSASSSADWTQFHRDNMQRWNPFETAIGTKNAHGLNVKWFTGRFVPEDGFCSTSSFTAATVANGLAYYGSSDGSLYAFNASTGARLWSLPCVAVSSTPAVANGLLYFVSTRDDSLEAVNAKTGAKLWSYGPLGGSETEDRELAVVDGVIYLCSAMGYVYAVNASNGALLWRNLAGFHSSPVVANGIVYAGRTGLTAFDAKTGARLWENDGGGEENVFDTPAVANGVVYFGFFVVNSTGFGVDALDAKTGAQRWAYFAESKQDDIGQIVLSSPAVAKGVVYIGSEAGTVYALDANTGAVKWTYETGGSVDTAPAVANGIVYVTDTRKDIALDANTGKLLWSYPIASPALPPGTISAGAASPTVVNGTVYFPNAYSYLRNGQPIGASDSLFAFSVGADLFLKIQASKTTAHQGDLLTYTFPVWNLGPGGAVHEVLMTQVPAGTTFDYIRVSGTPGLNTCTHPRFKGTGQIVCRENSGMAPNTTWTVRLTVKVTAPAGTMITESAATLADTFDPNLANNKAMVSIHVK